MFRNLLTRLFGEEPQPTRLSPQDSELAIAALLVRVARADDRYGRDEQSRIDQILVRRRGLDVAEVIEHRAAAEMIETEAPDTVRFTRMIKDRVALEDRLGVISALWEVAYADGRRSAEEESIIRLVSGLLGISDSESGIARRQVLEQLEKPGK